MHGFWYPEEDGEEPNLYGNWKSNVNMLMPNSVNAKVGFGNTFKVMICDIKKVDSEGGPNEPDDIFVEKSRLEEFSVNEAWRPVDAPYDEYKANN